MSVKIEDLKTGKYVAGYIRGAYVEGQLVVIEHDSEYSAYYFLQDRKRGSKPSMPVVYGDFGNYDIPSLPEDIQKLVQSYDCSWSFGWRKDDSTNDVKLVAIADTAEELNEKTDDMPFIIVYEEDVIKLSKKGQDKVLFRIKEHPDCCGASILYSFCSSEMRDYSNYRFLTPEIISELKTELLSINKSSKIAHVIDKQTSAIQLLEQLGFVKVHSYTNVKTNNVINIYQLDWYKEKTESSEDEMIDYSNAPGVLPNTPPPNSINRARRLGGISTASLHAYEVAMRMENHLASLESTVRRAEEIKTKPVVKTKSVKTKRAHSISRGVIPSFYKTAMESLRYRG